MEIRETKIYAAWFARLRDERAKARINARIYRLSLGNPGDVKPVGAGVSERGSITDRDIASISSAEDRH